MRTFNNSLIPFTVSDITILAVILILAAVVVFTWNICPHNLTFSAILSVNPTYSVNSILNPPCGVVIFLQVPKGGLLRQPCPGAYWASTPLRWGHGVLSIYQKESYNKKLQAPTLTMTCATGSFDWVVIATVLTNHKSYIRSAHQATALSLLLSFIDCPVQD